MSAEARVSIRVARRFDASAERVFDAWLDPLKAVRFLFATPAGEMVRIQIDARVGGRFICVDRRAGEDVEHSGQYLELDRPRRLVFSLCVPRYGQEIDRVTLELVPQGSGCELALTHEYVQPGDASRAQAGWTEMLEALAAALR
jgi:uncharacterized protein YndB with AHSA1/START domain